MGRIRKWEGCLCDMVEMVGELSPGTYLVVQWLRHCTPNAGGLGSIPGQGIRSPMLQLKIPCATNETWCSQMYNLKNIC